MWFFQKLHQVSTEVKYKFDFHQKIDEFRSHISNKSFERAIETMHCLIDNPQAEPAMISRLMRFLLDADLGTEAFQELLPKFVDVFGASHPNSKIIFVIVSRRDWINHFDDFFKKRYGDVAYDDRDPRLVEIEEALALTYRRVRMAQLRKAETEDDAALDLDRTVRSDA